MATSFSAEIFKLRKRPANWILGLVLVLGIVIIGYLSNYIFLMNARESGDVLLNEEQEQQTLNSLLPESVLTNVLSVLSGLGGPIALILGALAVGSEYGWGTLKLVLTQKPGKLRTFLGKIMAVGLVFILLSIMGFAFGASSSYLIGILEQASVDWPAIGDWIKAAGATWLILASYGALGVFLAALFRGTSLAIGLGLVYVAIIENLIVSLPIQGETFRSIQNALLSNVSTNLANSFRDNPQEAAQQQGSAQVAESGIVEPIQAVIILVAYLTGFILLTALLLRRRDVTQ